MGVRENKVERYLQSVIEELGGITRKWNCPGVDGVPDQIVIVKGNVYFIEIKTVDGKLSPGQKREHKRLISAGATVHTVYGDVCVDQFVDEYLK